MSKMIKSTLMSLLQNEPLQRFVIIPEQALICNHLILSELYFR